MAQSVERLTPGQVMMSWFVGSSLTSGSVLIAQSLESASDSVSPSLSLLHSRFVSLCLSKINKCKKKNLIYIYLEKKKHSEKERKGRAKKENHFKQKEQHAQRLKNLRKCSPIKYTLSGSLCQMLKAPEKSDRR